MEKLPIDKTIEIAKIAVSMTTDSDEQIEKFKELFDAIIERSDY